MSRRILSYSDLDTSTTIATRTVEVPNPNARHPEVQPMGPLKKKRKTNATHNRRTSMNIGLSKSSAAQGLGEFSSMLVSSPLLKARTDNQPAQSHWDTAPTGDATITLVYAENEPGSSNPLPEAGQAPLADPSNPTPISTPPIMGGSQFVGAPIALRKSFPASRPQPTPPQPVLPPTRSPAPAKPPQRANNANDKKGKGKASSNTSFPKISRHLTCEEIWDDSALVDAWDAAMDQYRQMNGGKDWSAVPVKESPLWYNVPPDETDSETDFEGEQDVEVKFEETASMAVEEAVQGDDIRLPAHRTPPSGLGGTGDGHQAAKIQSVDTSNSASLHAAATSGVSIRDHAFQKAKEASYALGYWTAIYELQSQKAVIPATNTTVGVASLTPESADHIEGEDEANEPAFVPTQR